MAHPPLKSDDGDLISIDTGDKVSSDIGDEKKLNGFHHPILISLSLPTKLGPINWGFVYPARGYKINSYCKGYFEL